MPERQGIQLRRHHHGHEILLPAKNTCLGPKGNLAQGGAWKAENLKEFETAGRAHADPCERCERQRQAQGTYSQHPRKGRSLAAPRADPLACS